jgi:hypothetical protein
MTSTLSDDSLRLQAEGFWNDAGVSSHTVRSVHTHQRALLKTTDVSYGTIVERGSIFTPGPVPENPPKRYLVENVQENYLSLLFVERKVETLFCEARQRGFHPQA